LACDVYTIGYHRYQIRGLPLVSFNESSKIVEENLDLSNFVMEKKDFLFISKNQSMIAHSNSFFAKKKKNSLLIFGWIKEIEQIIPAILLLKWSIFNFCLFLAPNLTNSDSNYCILLKYHYENTSPIDNLDFLDLII
jgi:hypothetical protein